MTEGTAEGLVAPGITIRIVSGGTVSWHRKIHSCPRARTLLLRVGRLPEPWKPCSEDISPLWLWNILEEGAGGKG